MPSSGEATAANDGRTAPERTEKYELLHEMVQVVQGLWGSWGEDALVADQASGRFADPAQVRPIGMRGRHVASRGPLPIPPSPQGQPVIFQAGGGGNGLEVAGRCRRTSSPRRGPTPATRARSGRSPSPGRAGRCGRCSPTA